MSQVTLSQALVAQTEEFPSWEQMSDVEQLHSIWWDAYKDAYGFRPRGQNVDHWTAADFHAQLEVLAEVAERAERARREDEHLAVVRFCKRVEEVIKSGAKNRETALRWIHQADGSNGDDEYLCYLNGLPYGFFRQAA